MASMDVVDRCTDHSSNSDQDLWFVTEVQPHGPALRAWLLARFPTLPDVDDVVQETFVRILRAHEVAPVRSARALLYVTARNLALDTVRRQKVVRFETITEKTSSFVFDDGGDILATLNQQQELEMLSQAIQSLPDRCRQVMTLRTSYGYTAKQIAACLRVSESTVDKAMAQGIRLCAVFFAGEGRR
jgi:RNA polymerase sigma factor (sigma-70 family)